MAENKRQTTTAKGSLNASSASTASGTATNMVPLEAALSGAIGARVRLTTSATPASTFEGVLFTACPITNLVAINTSPAASTADAKLASSGDYHVIPVSRIQNFQLLAAPSNSSDGPSFADAIPSIQALDLRSLRTREAKAVGEAMDREARRGKGVTREAQDIFDAFSRTMPAHWNGPNIVVADSVSIAPPYRVEDCRPLVAGNDAALMRVQKVLEMERKKIEFRNASATIGSTSTFTRNERKGG
ncbi:hypothetical protein N7539_000948 [Penicillium diatomitis]|uniref:AD domain-containing protein n=1 Tax=Penicillium diatomitis TaxID=2819901 RepID=A0A9X0C2P8_9EURO|nr:uncharacterized protein N7539_000948 [Penicillium diatomitis]KAJ5495832.1 hypothetical protein N7539_000948 [Penicillium diatomitis]